MNETKQITNLKTNTSALDIAHYLLSLDPERKFFTKRHGNFRLNSLLHIIQILNYVKFGKMAFYEDLIAYPPYWNKLSLQNQEQLVLIMNDKEIKDKIKEILKLYRNVKLTEQERKFLFSY
ncbi:MAG: hypothetical protein GBAus27B_000178 [Mycoplasmataceae bacterium]|nr:MAG: hypothetical protein GBAus27B_000178 [Mycoplasmataceae bacterium]